MYTGAQLQHEQLSLLLKCPFFKNVYDILDYLGTGFDVLSNGNGISSSGRSRSTSTSTSCLYFNWNPFKFVRNQRV